MDVTAIFNLPFVQIALPILVAAMIGFVTQNRRLDDIVGRLDRMEQRLDRIETKLDNHGERITRLEERTSPLQRR